jgi:PAS domain S-box-containing protein
MTTILIIGAENGGQIFLELLVNKRGISIVGVVGKDPDAPAIIAAKQLNIPVGPDLREFLKGKPPDVVINLAGQKDAEDVRTIAPGTEIIGGRSAALMFDLIGDARNALKQAAFQSAIIAQVRNAAVVTNLNGEVQYWNRYAEDMFQWRADEAVGRSFFGLILSKERQVEARELLAVAVFEGYWEGEIEAQKKDGSLFSVYMNNSVLRDDSTSVSLISISSDITELKRVHEAFRAEAGFRKAIEDAVRPGIVAYDCNGRQLYVNQGFCRIVGWSEKELIGISPPFPYWPPEELEHNASVFDSIMKGAGPSSIELLFRRRNGESFHARILTAPFHDDYGSLKGWVSSISDITEYKRREEKLRSSRRQLRALASHLEMEREAEKKETARRVHDDVGQPLAALKLELASLVNKFDKEQTAMLARTGMMNTIIDEGIGAVRRICTELRPWLLDDMEIGEAVKWQVMEFGKRTKIEYEFAIAPQDIPLSRDLSTTIFRVFQEILRNIELHSKATKVYVSLAVKQHMIFMEVKDNGIGIAEERIHDPRSYGLVSIRERVFTWGGKVEIRGKAKTGTTVRISLPR